MPRTRTATQMTARGSRVRAGITVLAVDWQCPACKDWFARGHGGPSKHFKRCPERRSVLQRARSRDVRVPAPENPSNHLEDMYQEPEEAVPNFEMDWAALPDLTTEQMEDLDGMFLLLFFRLALNRYTVQILLLLLLQRARATYLNHAMSMPRSIPTRFLSIQGKRLWFRTHTRTRLHLLCLPLSMAGHGLRLQPLAMPARAHPRALTSKMRTTSLISLTPSVPRGGHFNHLKTSSRPSFSSSTEPRIPTSNANSK